MKEETITEMFERWEKEDKPWFDANLCPDIIGKCQYLLRCKSSWIALLQKVNKETYFTFHDDKRRFGISETIVNQLMHLAYQKGLQHNNQKDYQKGYDAAMKDVAQKLGLDHEDH